MRRISFVINGAQMELDEEQVRAAVAGLSAEPARTHMITVGDDDYPVKQVFSAATGLDRLDFTTNQARSVLKRLGFVVSRVGEQ